MKLIKTLFILISFTFMSTGCRLEHSHGKKSSKTTQSNHTHGTEKEDEKHRH